MITRTDAGSRPLRTGVAVVALAALAWLLAGCSSSDGGAGDSASAMSYSEADMADGGGESEDVMSGSAQDADAAEGYAADTDRAVIITGSMFMTVDDPVAAATKAETIVRAAGGRVDARNEIAPSEYDGGSAWMTLRIPAGDLDGVVTNLRGLGTVDEYSTDSADVTNEVTDLEAQISTLKNSTERIEALLLEAEAIKDIITLENEARRPSGRAREPRGSPTWPERPSGDVHHRACRSPRNPWSRWTTHLRRSSTASSRAGMGS
nr:DUF4349 domain-containing protein [Demequina litorisediminis]